jgi:hypothetical protein
MKSGKRYFLMQSHKNMLQIVQYILRVFEFFNVFILLLVLFLLPSHFSHFISLLLLPLLLFIPSVGIETGYGLDGPGIESRWGRDVSYTSRPALGPTQPPVFPGGKAAGTWC